ncbi:lipocalin family protein [Mycobacterium sp. IDR2000157661]|uniref:lipocalin family protein n=1 Tax=Mycobacterium sp. IDR2000157661 TaxID=2867005 RepID=UPI001EEB8312|nr:lipocalin family protein [Mycobacterium sp. IDR2000157661]ULE33921.1 lipocalin family protein [Mycobacterium sp. IDR2000157661]
MSDEIVRWLGAGVVTAGVTAALLTCGTGLAAASTEGGSDANGTTASQSRDDDSEAADPDPDTDAGTDPDTDAPGADPLRDDTGAGDDDETGTDTGADVDGDEPDELVEEETEETEAPVEEADGVGAQPTPQAPVDMSDQTTDTRKDGSDPTVEDPSTQAFSTWSPSPAPEAGRVTSEPVPSAPETLDPAVAFAAAATIAAPEPAMPAARTMDAFDLPSVESTALVQAPEPAPARSPTDVLGSIVLNLLTGTARLLNPAPVTPPPSTVPAGRTTQAVAEQAAPLLPGATNGVTGVQVGHSRLVIPGAFIGNSVAADWYFPTQADGSVDAQGVIWLQHGFGATNTFYSALARELAAKTNSIVVAPTLSSIPFTFSGGCLSCASSQQAASAALLDPNRTALINSAEAAGYTGSTDALMGKFVLAGHSAGGGFATAVASDYLNDGTDAQDADFVGVLMFDGVSNGAMDGSFTQQVDVLEAAGKPIYQIAAPAQAWNAFGATTNALLSALPGQFTGVVLAGGSHVDSMMGVNPLFDLVLQLVTGRVPAGNTAAVYTLSTGWINDMYVGSTPSAPQYGFYAAANQQIIMGPAAALALPSPVANQLSFGGRVLTSVIDAVGSLFGFSILPTPINTGSNGLDPDQPVVRPVYSNGVTGVRTGRAALDIPVGDNGYAAPATWYFPTQADGTVQANGLVWLQHGFLGFNPWYSDMAQALAQETNSIVVAPTIPSFESPLCPGCVLSGEAIREAAASMFQGSRSALTVSANNAGLDGPLPEKFLLTGHSAGGNFATAVGALIVDTPQEDNLLGVVMFDGVSRAPLFTDSLQALDDAEIAVYQISAPPQRWNAWDVTTETMVATYPLRFNGLQIRNGSHTDVIAGDSLFAQLAEVLSSIVVRPSPPGAKAAVRTLATGWVNDIYAGNTTYSETIEGPLYGIYGPDGETPIAYDGGNKDFVMGEATAATLPAPPPVTVEDYLGTWYEQGSVPQFFSIGLVNTKAQYSLNADGSIRVENSGYYFTPNGLKSTIVGSAVPVNASNTRLNVGFFFGQPSANEPGNYWILDYAPDYSWAIVSDPSRFSGYILTRDQVVSDAEYDQLFDRAKQLGVRGPILRTGQYPTATVAV